MLQCGVPGDVKIRAPNRRHEKQKRATLLKLCLK